LAWRKSEIARWRVVVIIKASTLRPTGISIFAYALLGSLGGPLCNVAPALSAVNVIGRMRALVWSENCGARKSRQILAPALAAVFGEMRAARAACAALSAGGSPQQH